MSFLDTIILHKILPKFWNWIAERDLVKLFQNVLATKGFHFLKYCLTAERMSLKYIYEIYYLCSEAIPTEKYFQNVRVFDSFYKFFQHFQGFMINSPCGWLFLHFAFSLKVVWNIPHPQLSVFVVNATVMVWGIDFLKYLETSISIC